MVEPKAVAGKVVCMATRRQRTEDKDNMEVVGLRMKARRLDLDMDLEDVVALSKTRYAALHAYEAGSRLPNVFSGLRIAKALKVSAEDLFLDPPGKGEKERLLTRVRKATSAA